MVEKNDKTVAPTEQVSTKETGLMGRPISNGVKITETVLRDGHQSLIATRMTTEDMLPIIEKMDQAGYFSLEMWGGATFDVCLRFLKEDPWERLREIRKRVKNTKLQMLLRGQNLVGYRHYPDDIVVKFVQKARDNGIDIFRIFDALNDIRNLELAMKTAKKAGGIVEGTISYTVSPIHTIEKFVKFAFELKDAGADIICIKDMSGIFSPTAAYDLINALKKEVKLPIHLHTHCSSGMAPIVYMIACEAGVDILDTAISPFAWGTSQPPTESIVGALKGTPFDTGLDLNILVEISDYFQKIKEKYRPILDPISERVDPKILVHQIPGGMISNLISQLKEQNALNKYDEVLKETARVRRDLGYPPLVTPTSQIVGTQAVFNVIMGERYKMISKEVKDYIKGLYGRAPGPIDEAVQKKAIGEEQPITTRPADDIKPEWDKSLAEVKKIKQTEQPTDEDVLAYALFPMVTKEFWANPTKPPAPAPTVQPAAPAPVVSTNTTATMASAPAKAGEEPNKNAFVLDLNTQKYNIQITPSADNTLMVEVNGKTYEVKVALPTKPNETAKPAAEAQTPRPTEDPRSFGQARPKVETKPEPAKTEKAPEKIAEPDKPIAPLATDIEKPAVKPAAPANAFNVVVPMPGKIVAINVKEGDKVQKGSVLFILEAMKMQNEINCPVNGTIFEIAMKLGDSVDNQKSLIKIVQE